MEIEQFLSVNSHKEFLPCDSRKKIAPDRAFGFYANIACLASSVDKIAQSTAQIGYCIDGVDKDSKKNKVFQSDDFKDNLYFLMINYLLTGTACMVYHGSTLIYEAVNTSALYYDSAQDSYRYKEILYKYDVIKRCYISTDGVSQMHVAYTFSIGENDGFGVSKLEPLQDALDTIYFILFANKKTIQKGMTAGGFLTVGNPKNMMQKTFDVLTKTLKKYTGIGNAGEVGLLLGEDIKFVDTTIKNKDGGYLELLAKLEAQIYNAFGIPLPLVSQETMTMGNFTMAHYTFFQNVSAYMRDIRGVFKPLYDFDKGDRLVVSQDAPAVSYFAIEQAKYMQEVGTFTINELRAVANYKELFGGESVYAPSGMMPIASDDKAELEDAENSEKETEDDSTPDGAK